ncbi:hypothetical protein ACFBZI_11050 [Moraxella sp. ZJ142]|uniref:hypothetical protein n=1 Tax=Moraxella marmotae TaxID=3344520 RepID=UPI0035D464A3
MTETLEEEDLQAVADAFAALNAILQQCRILAIAASDLPPLDYGIREITVEDVKGNIYSLTLQQFALDVRAQCDIALECIAKLFEASEIDENKTFHHEIKS